MPGRADARATSARRAAQTRMRDAAARLREDGEIGDPRGARDGAARLLEHLAERNDLDTYTFDRAANLADRILTTPPSRALEGIKPLPAGYDNGQLPRRGLQ